MVGGCTRSPPTTASAAGPTAWPADEAKVYAPKAASRLRVRAKSATSDCSAIMHSRCPKPSSALHATSAGRLRPPAAKATVDARTRPPPTTSIGRSPRRSATRPTATAASSGRTAKAAGSTPSSSGAVSSSSAR